MRSGLPSSESPRSGQRFSLPNAMGEITVRLQLAQAMVEAPMVGRLWDVSASGGCIALPGSRKVLLPARGHLHLHDPTSYERHSLEVDVRWSSPLSHTTFIGVMFVGALTPAQTFLSGYMAQTWSDAVPRSRFEH